MGCINTISPNPLLLQLTRLEMVVQWTTPAPFSKNLNIQVTARRDIVLALFDVFSSANLFKVCPNEFFRADSVWLMEWGATTFALIVKRNILWFLQTTSESARRLLRCMTVIVNVLVLSNSTPLGIITLSDSWGYCWGPVCIYQGEIHCNSVTEVIRYRLRLLITRRYPTVHLVSSLVVMNSSNSTPLWTSSSSLRDMYGFGLTLYLVDPAIVATSNQYAFNVEEKNSCIFDGLIRQCDRAMAGDAINGDMTHPGQHENIFCRASSKRKIKISSKALSM